MKVHVIKANEPNRCEICRKVAELRPYGPHGMNVCFECGMKDEDEAKRQFCEHMDDTAVEPERN